MVQQISDSQYNSIGWTILVEASNGVSYTSCLTLQELKDYKTKYPEIPLKDDENVGAIIKFVYPIAKHKHRHVDIKKLSIFRKRA